MFEILVEPNRRRILDLLLDGERAAGDLGSSLAISQPAVSRHLKVLKEAGLVQVRVDGNRRIYRLDPEPLRRVDEWLAPYRNAWEIRLDLLGDHLDTMTEQPDQ